MIIPGQTYGGNKNGLIVPWWFVSIDLFLRKCRTRPDPEFVHPGLALHRLISTCGHVKYNAVAKQVFVIIRNPNFERQG